MSTSLKATVPVTVPFPAKLTFELPAVKVPLFVNDPLFAIVIVGVPEVDKVAPELMVNVFTLTLEEITAEFAVPDGMVTFVEDVGTPPHQLEAVFQSVLVLPNHVPEEETLCAPEALLFVVTPHPLVITQR